MASDLTETLQRVDVRLRELGAQIRGIAFGAPHPSAAHAAGRASWSDAEASDPVMKMLREVQAKGIDLPGGIDYVMGYRRAQMADEQDRPAMMAAAVAAAREELEGDRVILERGAKEGDIDAVNGLARLWVGLQDYNAAQRDLAAAAERFAATASARLVSVAPDLLGVSLDLGGDGASDTDGGADAEFTVISPFPDRAAAALARIAYRLLDVDENGVEMPAEERDRAGLDRGEAYTPNYVSDVEIAPVGARLRLDTKGAMWSAMGTTIVAILTDALSTDRVPAHIVGTCPHLEAAFKTWPGLGGVGH